MADILTTADGSSDGSDRRRAYWNRTGRRRWAAPRLLAVTLSLVLILASLPLTAAVTAAASSQPDWSQLSPSTSPSARVAASMAFDPATGQFILFGGLSGSGRLNDTWTWDGTTWTHLSPSTSPSARNGASMAFDPATGQLILSGGYNGIFLNDTWVWDGTTWTHLSPSTSPSAQFGASMAFDPATGQLILFGGFRNSGYLNETWSWDGSTWTQLSPTTSPSARNGASMAFDPATGQLLLFGGYHNGDLDDTWGWDGTSWSELAATTSPSARNGANMAFDPATGQMILFGGSGSSGYRNDTWSWDGSTWTQLSLSTSPSARYLASMAFDPATGQIVLFGGQDNSGSYGDTWVYAIPSFGTDWSQLNPVTSPSARENASLAFDPATGQMILFGGFNSASSVRHDDTWTWNGTTWTKLSPATSPTARSGASMAFDPATGQLILFGGWHGSYFDDTWSWDGSTWTQISPSASPSARSRASMAFDPATGRLILFGGYGSSSGNLHDTWAWDGSTWHDVTPATSPPAREGASMAFDPATGQMILFGGNINGNYLDDTWSWDGSTWHDVTPVSGNPAARYLAGLAFDQATGQLILFGGYGGSSGNLHDTWAWDGSIWHDVTPATSPPAREGASMAFDPATGQMILFGGKNDGNYLDDTWELELVIDTTPPSVTYSGNQGTYTVDQTVNITCTATDDLSGVASTTCADITGPAYSFALGVNTYSATATDYAGNVGVGSTSFTVGVTPDSLCALTKQFVSNRRDASRLCSPLTGIKWAEAMGSQQLKASFVNSYIYLVNLQRGLSRQQKAILIQLAQAL